MPCIIRLLVRLLVALSAVAVAAPILGAGQAGRGGASQPVVVEVDSGAKRLHYLATARIWADPGELTPQALLAGPPLTDGTGVESALDGRPFPCTFAEPGKTLGGNTPKFSCTTATGATIRVKYSDQSKKANREIFAALAASRLMWALGFKTYPIYPLLVDCKDCPEDPISGNGKRARHSYLATYQPRFTDPVIVDREKPSSEGWRWAELDKAIDSLPAGELRSRQRQHFDALVLAGVLLQHGDRKKEQQRLSCQSRLNIQAGSVRPLGEGDAPGGPSVLVENPGATACDEPIVAVQDVGATFGGAGKRTNGETAKMNLKAWVEKPVFQSKGEPGKVSECRGQLTVSIAAGEGSMGNPRIGEAGRLFLVDRLRRLTDDHLRAIFMAARVEQITEDHTAVDAWVKAFKDKVRQIEERTCAP